MNEPMRCPQCSSTNLAGNSREMVCNTYGHVWSEEEYPWWVDETSAPEVDEEDQHE